MTAWPSGHTPGPSARGPLFPLIPDCVPSCEGLLLAELWGPETQEWGHLSGDIFQASGKCHSWRWLRRPTGSSDTTRVGHSAYFQGRLLRRDTSGPCSLDTYVAGLGCVTATPAVQAQAKPPGGSAEPGSAPPSHRHLKEPLMFYSFLN